MIAPEGIRDGRYFAEALYTFAGEGVEDLPFKKGDLIEVLDCDEDGLFPACLVKFTEAPVAQEAIKTAERLARLSDVLTPAYAKQQSEANGSLGNGASDPNDANSIESLLLNMANNEMQVQQQKIQAHMPQKPTRMKLLYEDHSHPDGSGRSSSMTNYADLPSKQHSTPTSKPQNTQAKARQLPLPKPQQQKSAHKSSQSIDMSLSQIGLWAPSRSSTQSSGGSQNNGSGNSNAFSASIESMREATLRTEEASQNRSSGSMLFGPRGMPQQPSSHSRSSSRANDNSMRSEPSTLRSPFTTITSYDAFNPNDSRTSYASLYSQGEYNSTVAKAARAAHEAAISEARQMLDGIPSPIEHGREVRHEAEHLFNDDCVEDDSYEASDVGKFQSLISPASENSARFMSYADTVSSRVSSVAESTNSKRLPMIPSTANGSMVSDTSSVGLVGGQNSSAGDLTNLHRSWYSSTESLNIYGGGGLKSATIDEVHDEEDEDQADSYAPKSTKNKARIRALSDTPPKSTANDTVTNIPASVPGDEQYSGNYDTRYDIASDFQRMMNLSTNSPNLYGSVSTGPYAASSIVESQSSMSEMNPAQTQQMHQQQSLQEQPQRIYNTPPNSQPGAVNGGPMAVGYMTPVHTAYANGVVSQGYAQPVYSGVDANGRPYSAYQPQSQQQPMYYAQQYQPQPQQYVSNTPVGGMTIAVPVGVPGVPNMSAQTPVQAGYYDPRANAPSRLYQPQPQMQPQTQTQPQAQQMFNGQRPMSGATAPQPMHMSGSSAVGYRPPTQADLGPVPPISADDFGRPRSYTAGPSTEDRSSSERQGQPAGVPAQQNGLRPSSSAGVLPNIQVSAGGGRPIPGKQEQQAAAPGTPSVQRPASFADTSSLSNASGRAMGAMTPDNGFTMRSSTPSGFGTFSSTPPATFARREGNMSPFPSNVGPSQAGTYSASPVQNMPRDMFIDDIDPVLAQPLPADVTPINFVKMTRPVFKFGGHISHPESVNWGKVDRQMAMIKSISVKLTADVLATMHVGRPFNKPIERVRGAFIWIASNIQYDASTAESNEEFEQQEAPNAVLQRRRSRGPGFAYLFDAMMNALGIECTTIRGYLRQPLDVYQGVVLPAANHVWNAVCLDGEYRIIDTASAAKSHPLNAESKTDPWFFLAPPKETIFTHYPLTPVEQFVDPPVPLPVFWMLPYVRPTYFTSKVKLLNLPHVPRIELRDEKVIPLVLCVRDSTLSVFAEVELHDPNGSGRIVARQPLLAQCMDYRGKRMVKILVGVRAADARGLIKIYCGTRLALQPKRATDDAANGPGSKTQKVLGFLQGKERRPSAHDYTRIKDVDEEGKIKTVATSKTYPLACVLPVVHRGRNNAPLFAQLNAAAPNEFYIKEPTDAQFHLGESINFHLLPVGDERLFHLQLRSPSGQQHKFVYQPSDQGYVLRHTVKERGAWIIVYHTDTDGWLPIVSYSCV
ncbi:hypothetical protein GGI07_000458 [Coemansia sp. Benny D115]|nr:hypothetical protein GGI07_000458 [Coemansia sp. Benny D115]